MIWIRPSIISAKGLKVAREQKAKSLELRLCLSMCDLYDLRKNADKCRSQLGDVYRSFSEGFDTADLVRAKATVRERSIRCLSLTPIMLLNAARPASAASLDPQSMETLH